MNETRNPSAVVSNYSSPKSLVGSDRDAVLEVWKPLLFLLFSSIVMGIFYSDPVKPLLSRNGASLLNAILIVAMITGLIWWAKCDAYRYNYKLTKVKVWLLVLFGPTGIIIYSFFVRGFIGGVFLIIKMVLFLFALVFASGFSAFVVNWAVQ